MTNGQLVFYSLTTYGAGFFFSLFGRTRMAFLCMMAGLLLGSGGLILRYSLAWPMMPMHIGMHGLLCLLSVIWLCCRSGYSSGYDHVEGLLLQALIILLTTVTVLFPKDYYLPFIRSATFWSHGFLLTSIAAKGFLLMAALRGILVFFYRHTPQTPSLTVAMFWALWGFACLTISMFSGEIWSYLGWGTPVVWRDPAITAVMAIWLYWTAFLHLHYTRHWKQNRRAVVLIGGGLLVLVFTCLPDMGPLRLPFK